MRGPIGALVYLRLHSLQNLLLSRFKRLKEPKYLVGGIVGVAYIYFSFLRRLQGSRAIGANGFDASVPAETIPTIAMLGALLITIYALLCWVWQRSRASLTFSEAEIAFLFPAPLRRSTLINYRLLSAQPGILFTAIVMGVVSTNWQFLPAHAFVRIFGWWLIFSTLWLHTIGSSFVITRWLDRGITSLRRQLLALAVMSLLIVTLAIWIGRDWRAPRANELQSFTTISTYFSAMLTTGPLPWLLAPARWVIQPLLSPTASSFFIAMGPALAIFAAHYLWVLRAEVSFEEGSIAKAAKRAAKVAAMREGKFQIGGGKRKVRRAPFNLAKLHRPEWAFFWKNLLSTAEYLRPRTALIAAAIIVIGSRWLAANPSYEVFSAVIGTSAIGIAAYVLFFGPLLARQDLRNDLLNADVLKTYPLRGWQIVLGEIITPIAVVTVLLWLLLLSAVLNFKGQAWLTMDIRVFGAVGVALLAPFLCAIEVLVMNVAVVLFPAWMQVGQARGGGIDVMGTRLFFFAGLIIAILLALLPAAIASSACYFFLHWIFGVRIAAVCSAIVLLSVLAAELVFSISWLGKRFENFDLSAELRP